MDDSATTCNRHVPNAGAGGTPCTARFVPLPSQRTAGLPRPTSTGRGKPGTAPGRPFRTCAGASTIVDTNWRTLRAAPVESTSH